MEYDRFNELITARHHIVVKNWPLKKFCNPSNITSRIELELLHNAWQSGVTHFQKLSDEEMEAWEIDRFSSRMKLMSPAESTPAPTQIQTPGDMTLVSELSHQDCPDIPPAPPPPTPSDTALTTVTNLTPRPAVTTESHPLPIPDPEMIARMIQANPTLQNVDPALIAMGIAQNSRLQVAMTPNVTATTTTAPPIEPPPSRTFPADGAKRRWQEVVTPLSFDAHASKKPRKQRKERSSQNFRDIQGSINRHSSGVSTNHNGM